MVGPESLDLETLGVRQGATNIGREGDGGVIPLVERCSPLVSAHTPSMQQCLLTIEEPVDPSRRNLAKVRWDATVMVV